MKTYILWVLALIPSYLVASHSFAVGTAVVLPGNMSPALLDGSPCLRMMLSIGRSLTATLYSALIQTSLTTSIATTIGYMYNR
ncbi:hypothetical protein OH492_11825 [Vibrio chagasii]|nr:hypothetical protein [Vibrio chagasii]